MSETASATTGQAAAPKKKLILNAFVESCSGHQSPGLWQHPDDHSADFNNVKHWVKLAQLLEKGGFHGMFIADVLVCILRSLCLSGFPPRLPGLCSPATCFFLSTLSHPLRQSEL